MRSPAPAKRGQRQTRDPGERQCDEEQPPEKEEPISAERKEHEAPLVECGGCDGVVKQACKCFDRCSQRQPGEELFDGEAQWGLSGPALPAGAPPPATKNARD